MKSVDSILEQLQIDTWHDGIELDIRAEAKAALYATTLEIIGEDEEESFDEGSAFWKKIRNRNKLRDEQRDRAKKFYGI